MQAAALPSTAGAWILVSHLLVAALSVAATIAYTKRREKALPASGGVGASTPAVSVEMRRYQYQPVV